MPSITQTRLIPFVHWRDVAAMFSSFALVKQLTKRCYAGLAATYRKARCSIFKLTIKTDR